MENFNLNVIPSGVSPVCHVSQYDNGRQIKINLFSGTLPYELASGDTVTLNLRKPDNTIITASVSATAGNDYVVITTTEQMTAVVGETLGELKITNGSTVIGTLNFIMLVERDVVADGIASESVIEDLNALVIAAVGDNYYTKTETDAFLAVIDGNINNIDDILDLGIITRSNVLAEVGGINVSTGGLDNTTVHRARTDRTYIGDNIVKVKMLDATYDYYLIYYNASGTYLGKSDGYIAGTTESIANYSGASYFRLMFRAHANPSVYDFTGNIDTLLSKLVITEYVDKKVVDNLSYCDTPIIWEVGSIVSGVPTNNKQTARSACYLACDSNSFFNLNDSNLSGKVAFYSSNFEYLTEVDAPTVLDYGGAKYCKPLIINSGNNTFIYPNDELAGKYSVKKMVNGFDYEQNSNKTLSEVLKLEKDTGHSENPDLFYGVISTNGPINTANNRVYCADSIKLDDYKAITVTDNSVNCSWRNYDKCGNFFYVNSGWSVRYESIVTEAQNIELTYFNFEVGTLNIDTGKNLGATNRIRTKNFVPYDGNDAITINSGYKCAFRFYDEDFNYIARKSFGTTSTSLADAAASATVLSGYSIDDVKYYRLICATTSDDVINGVTDIINSGVKVTISSLTTAYVKFNARYSNDRVITSVDEIAAKIIMIKNIDNNYLYGSILELDKNPAQYVINTGNSTIRAAKEHNFVDGSRSVIEWYLLEEPDTHKFYYSKDLKTKKYLFTFDGNSDIFSFGITAEGDVIAVQDAASFPWVADPDRGSGYYIGSESYRQNPIVFLAREQYKTQHVVEFGNALKPCGWDKSIRCRVMSDGSFMFVEYTRPTVLTCNIWKLVGDPLNKDNWTYNASMSLTLSGNVNTGLKHYHYIQEDQYTGVVYVGTGDDDVGSTAWYSTDGGATFTQLSITEDGQTYTSSEKYFRLLNYVFTEEYIYYATDTNKEGKHKVYRCGKDQNGVIDFSTVFRLADLSWYDEKDRTKVNRLATYGTVLIPECNALLLMERMDGSASGITEVPIRVVDLSIADADIVYNVVNNIVYNSSNVIEAYWLKQIAGGTYRNLGFECRYMDYYPLDGVVNVGYNLSTVANLQEANPNRCFGNTGDGQSNGINSFYLKLSKNVDKFIICLGMNYN